MTSLPEQSRTDFLNKYSTWLIGLACAAIIASVIVSASFNQEQAEKEELYPERSIYNVQSSGYRAWYLALQKAKSAPQIWKSSFDALHKRSLATFPQGSTMVLIQPLTQSASEVRFGSHQAKQLLNWVKQGNTLFLIDDFKRAGSQSIAQALGLQTEDLPSKPTSRPLHILPNQIDTVVKAHLEMPIASRPASSFKQLPTNSTVWIEDAKTQAPLLLQVPYGRGSLILSTLTDLAENSRIQDRHTDNYQLMFNLLSAMPGQVWINEYVHGYVLHGNLISFYQQKTPLGDISNQLLLILILMVWVGLSRWKPVRAISTLDKKPPLNPSFAFMHALASLYEKNQAGKVPLGLQLASLDRGLMQHYGIASNETDRVNDLIQNCFKDYSGGSVSPQQLQTALQEAQAVNVSSRRLKAQDTLRLSQALTQIEKGLLRDYRHR